MATPITDLGQRLHDAGFTPEQTRAVASAFEALYRKVDDVERHPSRVSCDTATPITDLEQRLRDADFTEAQARALASAFEALCERLFAGRS